MAVTVVSGVTDIFRDTSSGGGGITSMQITEVATTYTVVVPDDIVIATGTFTVSLPPLSTALKSVTIKSTIGGGTITLDGDGSETIDGALTQAITSGTSITVAPSSTEWVII